MKYISYLCRSIVFFAMLLTYLNSFDEALPGYYVIVAALIAAAAADIDINPKQES